MNDAAAEIAKPIRERTTEEPVGRFDNRCPFLWDVGGFQLVVCDRRTGHKGMHHGRLIDFNTKHVKGWMTVRYDS